MAGAIVFRQTDRQTDELSIENTNCIKGLCALGVLAHHLYQHSGVFRSGYLRYIGAAFQALGFYMVAIFFFLSGYGLYCSSKNNNKLDGFVLKKIVPFYLIIVFYTAIYALFTLLCGSSIGLTTIMKSLLFGGTVIANGWYLQVQLLYYIIFFVVMRYFPSKYQVLTTVAFLSIYTILCILTGLSFIFYERAFVFVLGMMWAKYHTKINKYLSVKKHFIVCFIVSFVLFAMLYCLSYLGSTVPIRSLSYFPFIIFIVLLLKVIPINCSITRFLGEISLEIYTVQGLFMLLFHQEWFYVSNPCLYILLVSVSTFVSAIILHPVSKKIYSLFRKQKANQL